MTDLSETDIEARVRRLEQETFGKGMQTPTTFTGLTYADYISANVPTSYLEDGEWVVTWLNVPAGKTLEITEAGVQTTNHDVPAGLTIEAELGSNGSTTTLAASKFNSGTPLYTVDGPADIGIRVENQTGSPLNASGNAVYKVD